MKNVEKPWERIEERGNNWKNFGPFFFILYFFYSYNHNLSVSNRNVFGLCRQVDMKVAATTQRMHVVDKFLQQK